jgi:peptide/nickel transport system permease protein
MGDGIPPIGERTLVDAEHAVEAASLDVEIRGRDRPAGNWVRWTLKRAVIIVLTLFAISLIVFGDTQVLPGDAAEAILGRTATPSEVTRLQAELGLDRSAVDQYGSWLGGLLTGDLGDSLVAKVPVSEYLSPKIENTALLVLIATLVTIPLSIVIGVYSAVRRDTAPDRAVSLTTIVLNAIPDFVVALVLVVLFATTVFEVLPAVSILPPGASPLSELDKFVLPAASLIIVCIPYLARLVRASMIDVLESEYIVAAQLRGLPKRRVLYGHALRNALVPMIQGSAQVLAYMAGGIVVVEFVFGFPGLGEALVAAVQTRDLPVIQAITMILAVFYVLVNLVADMLSVAISPQLRTSGEM